METAIATAARKLRIKGEPVTFEVIKTGNINKTYLVGFSDMGRVTRYIVQRVNGYVFKNPVGIMENIAGITAHLHGKYAAAGIDCTRLVLDFCTAENGESWYSDEEGGFWRAYKYIENTLTYDTVPDPKLLTSAGAAFGGFMKLLADYDMASLNTTIPDFHNTKKRFETFRAAAEADSAGRAGELRDVIDYCYAHESFCSQLVDMQADGRLATRVTHNDTKYNNVLIDTQTGEPQAIIDLDTVMPGLAAYDFGDAIRFAANTSAEDEPDTSKTSLSLPYYEAFCKGYIGALRDTFDEAELMSLPTGALMMTIELVMRFATDYLQGDPYFKINYPTHNLVRTRCQLALARDMEEKFTQMQGIVKKYM